MRRKVLRERDRAAHHRFRPSFAVLILKRTRAIEAVRLPGRRKLSTSFLDSRGDRARRTFACLIAREDGRSACPVIEFSVRGLARDP
jgi:hypothetical protein